LIFGFLIAWLLLFVTIDRKKPLWIDEILTLWVARQPDFKSIWHALEIGPQAADSPFYAYIAHHLIPRVGSEPLALRLPSSVGVIIACLTLYLVAARRCSPLAASVALLYPLTTIAVMYGSEGRPYGMWLAFTALAVLCWQQVDVGRHRAISLVGLALCLACGVLSHYYSVFITAVFGVAELVRTWERRRVDPGVWGAFLFSGLPVLGCWPLISIARSYPKDSWAETSWFLPIYIYEFFGSLLGILIFVVLLLWVSVFVLRRREDAFANDSGVGSTPPPGPHLSEITLAMGLAVLPIFMGVVAHLVTKNMAARYALPSIGGIALLLSFLVDKLGRQDRVAKAAFALVLGILVAYNFRATKKNSGIDKAPPGAEFEQKLQSRPDKTIPLLIGISESSIPFEGYFYHPSQDLCFVPMAPHANANLLYKLVKPFTDAKILDPGELGALGKFYIVPGSQLNSQRLLFKFLKESGAHFSNPTLMESGETLYLVEIDKHVS